MFLLNDVRWCMTVGGLNWTAGLEALILNFQHFLGSRNMCTTCTVSPVLSLMCDEIWKAWDNPSSFSDSQHLLAQVELGEETDTTAFQSLMEGPFVLRHSERCVRQLVCHSRGNSRAVVSPRVRCLWYCVGAVSKFLSESFQEERTNSVSKRSQTLQTTYFMIPFTINLWSVHKRHIYCEKEDICSFPTLRVGTVTSTGNEAWFWNDENVLDCINNDSTLYIW